MPTLKQLRYLIALDDTRHFGRAAERCRVTQPTLSAQLLELERRLGASLLERRRQGVLFTGLGQEIVARARIVVREADNLVDFARQRGAALYGTLKIGALPTLGPYLLPLILPQLHKSYPELRLLVQEGRTERLYERLDDGHLDALLIALPAPRGDFATARLFSETLQVILPVDHPLAAKDKLSESDLRGQSVLAIETGYHLRDQVEQLCKMFGAHLLDDFEGTSLDTIRLMVGMGAGLSFLPALYVRSETPKDPQVVVRPLQPRPPRRLAGLVWRQGSSQDSEFRIIAAVIRDAVSDGIPGIVAIS